jgi:hypothetical protein
MLARHHDRPKQVLDDYAAMPPDRNRCELLEGDLLVTPAPSPLHPWVSKRLQRQLEDDFEGRGRVYHAPVDVILTRRGVLQPDPVVVTDLTHVSGRGIEGPPRSWVRSSRLARRRGTVARSRGGAPPREFRTRGSSRPRRAGSSASGSRARPIRPRWRLRGTPGSITRSGRARPSVWDELRG